jgi:two-component sensor histidine kinase/ABC-type amino acid transport substrate-binding protein
MPGAKVLIACLLLSGLTLSWSLPSSITVVCDDDYPPYAMRGLGGSLEGIVPDFWRAWEKQTGIRVQLRGMSWALALAAAQRGEADVIDMIFDTPQRRLVFDFMPPYATIQVPVFIHKSISGIASVRDLIGFSVAVKSGDAAVDSLKSGGVNDLLFFSKYEEIIDAAAKLKVRIFCIDKPPAYYYLYKKKIDNEFRTAFVLGEGKFHRAVLKGHADLLKIVQDGFEAVPSSTIAAIEWKWLGSDLVANADLRLLSIAAAVILCIVAFLVINSWALRRRIRAATADLEQKIVQLEQSEKRNQLALAEKEVLLKEIHHRVKNNLQIVSSLIQLKSDELHDDDDRLLLVDIRQRILVLAQLHELLYQSRDLASINASEYLEAIARDTARAYSWPEMEAQAENLVLSIDEALPLGLVADELLVNAMKYTYPFGEKGPIRLLLYKEEGRLVMRIEDKGVGLPPGIDPSRCGTMGFTIVRGLAEQLSGELVFSGPPGLCVELRIPLVKNTKK